MDYSELRNDLCKSFCREISVHPVPAGYAVSTAFEDSSGDRLTFYVVETPDGPRLEDDGDYLASLLARDIPIFDGTRRQLLDAILIESDLFWDHDTFEIKSGIVDRANVHEAVVRFISALIRVRDLEHLSRENIRSTFREDFVSQLDTRAAGLVAIEEDAVISKDLAEFPADLVIRSFKFPQNAASVFLVNNNEKLSEALLMRQDLLLRDRSDVSVFGVIEEPDMRAISRKKFQRAQNRGLAMPIFRGDEDNAVGMILRRIGLKEVNGVF